LSSFSVPARLAPERELTELETAWRQVEEVAAVADDLLMPPSVGGALSRLKRDR
jgi:hypothetical protein